MRHSAITALVLTTNGMRAVELFPTPELTKALGAVGELRLLFPCGMSIPNPLHLILSSLAFIAGIEQVIYLILFHTVYELGQRRRYK